MESEKDKKALVEFMKKSRTKYKIKKSDKYEGLLYKYENKTIWKPKKYNNLDLIEKIWKEMNIEKPVYYVINKEKILFKSFEESLYDLIQKKRKEIAFVFSEENTK